MSPAALAAMTRELAQTGNPSSLHGAGRRAHRVMEESREQLAAAAGAHASEVIFTSGGTESDNLAIKGLYWNRRDANPARKRILCSVIEHHAVLDTVEWLQAHEGAEVTWLPVDSDGVIDLAVLEAEIAKDPESIALLTLMWANNEVGSIQPIDKVVALAEPHGIPVHSDAVQAFTAVPISFADSGLATMAVSGHKIGGPVGIGALFVRRNVVLTPVQHGGGHERALRSGTLNAAAAAGFAAAATEAAKDLAAGKRTPGHAARRPGGRGARAGPGGRLQRHRGPGPRRHPASGQRALHLPGLRGRLAALRAGHARGALLHGLGLHRGRAASLPRVAGHGPGRGNRPRSPALHARAYIERRRR